MERRVNYTIVGLFIVGSVVLFVIVLLWLGRVEYEGEYDHYLLYFKESVSGLNVGSPVKYRGIKVGSVEMLSINPQKPEMVEVLIKVRKGTPIRKDTTALLSFQGITGLAYIELMGGTHQSPPIVPKKAPPYPVIKTRPSIITRLDKVITTLSQKTVLMVSRLNLLLSHENIQSISTTLKNMALVSSSLSSQREALERTINDLARASHGFPDLVEHANRDLEMVQDLLAGLKGNQAQISQLLDEVQTFLQREGEPLAFTAQGSLQELQRTLLEAKGTLRILRETLQQIGEHPSQLIFGGPPRKLGPGEKP